MINNINSEQSYPNPPLGFYFEVIVLDPAQQPDENQGSTQNGPGLNFQSVSGLTMEVETETYTEGGNNDFDYVLPVKTKYSPLVLKRGLWIPELPIAPESENQTWVHDMMRYRQINPKNLTINLLKAGHGKKNEESGKIEKKIFMSWFVNYAWPVKWTISDFNAQENQVVIETIELRYDNFYINKL